MPERGSTSRRSAGIFGGLAHVRAHRTGARGAPGAPGAPTRWGSTPWGSRSAWCSSPCGACRVGCASSARMLRRCWKELRVVGRHALRSDAAQTCRVRPGRCPKPIVKVALFRLERRTPAFLRDRAPGCGESPDCHTRRDAAGAQSARDAPEKVHQTSFLLATHSLPSSAACSVTRAVNPENQLGKGKCPRHRPHAKPGRGEERRPGEAGWRWA